MIKVLIAEDSPSIAAMMRDLLERDPEIEVVGWAKTGHEAIGMRNALGPDIMTMDLNMPLMGGLDAIKIISTVRPVPILVVSQLIENRDSEVAFEALRCGAIDIMGKPSGAGPGGYAQIGEELIFRIKTVSRIRPMHVFSKPAPLPAAPTIDTARSHRQSVDVIGPPTGGPPAVGRPLKSLPPNPPAPVP